MDESEIKDKDDKFVIFTSPSLYDNQNHTNMKIEIEENVNFTCKILTTGKF